jgi:signal transduction histidine kinase
MLKLADDQARVRKAADVIERNALLQIRMVEDLLEITRVMRGKAPLDVRVLELYDAIRTAAEPFMDAAAQKNVTVNVIDADMPLCVRADANRVQQVFRNVISNALKFTPVGGAVTVTLSTHRDRVSSSAGYGRRHLRRVPAVRVRHLSPAGHRHPPHPRGLGSASPSSND